MATVPNTTTSTLPISSTMGTPPPAQPAIKPVPPTPAAAQPAAPATTLPAPQSGVQPVKSAPTGPATMDPLAFSTSSAPQVQPTPTTASPSGLGTTLSPPVAQSASAPGTLTPQQLTQAQSQLGGLSGAAQTMTLNGLAAQYGMSPDQLQMAVNGQSAGAPLSMTQLQSMIQGQTPSNTAFGGGTLQDTSLASRLAPIAGYGTDINGYSVLGDANLGSPNAQALLNLQNASAPAAVARDQIQQLFSQGKTWDDLTPAQQGQWNQSATDLNAAAQASPLSSILGLTGSTGWSGSPAGWQAHNAAVAGMGSQPTAPSGPASYLQAGQTVDANGNPVSGYNALSDLIRQQTASGTTPGVVTTQMQQLLAQNPNLGTSLSPTQASQFGATLNALGYPAASLTPPAATTGSTATGAGTPASGTGSSSPLTPSATPSASLSPAPPTPTGAQTGVTALTPSGATAGTDPNMPAPNAAAGVTPQMSTVNPGADLRSQQITPGSALNRFNLAQQQYGTYASATDPQYQASLRDAARAAAATGGLGSGMLRTSYGDLANLRAQSLQNERDTLFQNALSGSAQDAQNQFQDLLAEQGYQTGAQNQAFNQAVTSQQLQDALTGSAFSRGLQQMEVGMMNDPSQMNLALSQLAGGQATGAMSALGQMVQGLAAGGNNSDSQLLAYLLGSQGGGGGTGLSNSAYDWLSNYITQSFPTAATLPVRTTPSGTQPIPSVPPAQPIGSVY